MADTKNNYGFGTTADEVLEGIDLSNKVVVITGGASGLGLETARAMAFKGAHIVIPVRHMEKGKRAAAKIKAATGSDKIDLIELDLSSMDSIRAFGAAFKAKYDHIDILINNAGVMACPYTETTDGLELQFGTNHIGPFYMTNLLMPEILKGAPARIIVLASVAHHRGNVDFDDPQFKVREYDKWLSYGESKTANVQFSVGLQCRLESKGVDSYAVHPGNILTNVGRHLSESEVEQFLNWVDSDENVELKTVEQGAATICYAATAPELEGRGGVYLEDCHIADIDDESEWSGVRSFAIDPRNADALWELSEAIVGETFAY